MPGRCNLRIRKWNWSHQIWPTSTPDLSPDTGKIMESSTPLWVAFSSKYLANSSQKLFRSYHYHQAPYQFMCTSYWYVGVAHKGPVTSSNKLPKWAHVNICLLPITPLYLKATMLYGNCFFIFLLLEVIILISSDSLSNILWWNSNSSLIDYNGILK